MSQQSQLIGILVGLFVICGGAAPTQAVQQDLEQYIASIRESGMSESANGYVNNVAIFQVGPASLSFSKDEESGQYFPSIQGGAVCFIDPEEGHAFGAELQEKTRQEVKRLKPYADADGSGFVSSAEGQKFYGLFEFGTRISFVVKGEGSHLDAVVRGMGMTSESLKETVLKYNKLLERMKRYQGKPFPTIPPLS